MVSIMALKILKLFVFTLYLSSCSSNSSFDRLKTFSAIYFNQNLEKPYKVFTRQELNQIKYPIIEVRTNHILKQALMIPISSRYNFYNFISGMGQSITFEGNSIIRTLGMDIGLLSLENDKKRHLIDSISPKKWPKTVNKSYKIIDQSFSAKEYYFNCTIKISENVKMLIIDKEHELIKIIEDCKSQNSKFSNLYFVKRDGLILKSKQFIPPAYNYIEITKLN